MGIHLVPAEQDLIEVLEPNLLSVAAFLECKTQWRMVSGFAGITWTGLDYPAVKLVLDELDCPRGVFADIRLMEAAALEVLNSPEQ